MTDVPHGRPGVDDRLLVLHVLRLIGFSSVERIVDRCGSDSDATVSALEILRLEGDVIHRDGQVSGWTLTAQGRATHTELLAAERKRHGADEAVRDADLAFRDLNEQFKQLCLGWQMMPNGASNDHSDREYDSALLEELDPIHEQITAITTHLARTLPRFGRYSRAFDNARYRLLNGDTSALTSPLSDSYHDVWMELHQDLLCTTGRERDAADGH